MCISASYLKLSNSFMRSNSLILILQGCLQHIEASSSSKQGLFLEYLVFCM